MRQILTLEGLSWKPSLALALQMCVCGYFHVNPGSFSQQDVGITTPSVSHEFAMS
jgi:hypothetical protein